MAGRFYFIGLTSETGCSSTRGTTIFFRKLSALTVSCQRPDGALVTRAAKPRFTLNSLLLSSLLSISPFSEKMGSEEGHEVRELRGEGRGGEREGGREGGGRKGIEGEKEGGRRGKGKGIEGEREGERRGEREGGREWRK